MGLGKLQAFLMGVFGGAVSGQGATTGQALVKQANGSWAPGTVGGGATVTATTAFILGSADTNGIRLDLEGGNLAVREGDDSAYGNVYTNFLSAENGITSSNGTISALRFVAVNDGLIGAMPFSSNDNNCGMYFPALNTLELAVDNTACFTATTALITLTASSIRTAGTLDIAGNATMVNAGTGFFNVAGSYLSFAERGDPSAPSSNIGLLYARDNGAGKTQLCVRFPTGAVQVLATEP